MTPPEASGTGSYAMPRVTACGLDIVRKIQQLEVDDPRRSSAVFVVQGMGRQAYLETTVTLRKPVC